jgi:hypothetical protein
MMAEKLSLNPAPIESTIEELLFQLQLNYNKLQDYINNLETRITDLETP